MGSAAPLTKAAPLTTLQSTTTNDLPPPSFLPSANNDHSLIGESLPPNPIIERTHSLATLINGETKDTMNNDRRNVAIAPPKASFKFGGMGI